MKQCLLIPTERQQRDWIMPLASPFTPMNRAQRKFESCRTLAEKGEPQAQFDLGYCYMDGIGVEADKEEAFQWFRKSAERGNADGQCMLATCYDFGCGTRRDRSEGVQWYRKAAAQEHTLAQWRLGICYRDARGVSRNLRKAIEWSHKAKIQGCKQAKSVLAELIEELLNDAGRGNVWAQEYLIHCYEDGIGVEPSPLLADSWRRRMQESHNRQDEQKDDSVVDDLPTFTPSCRLRFHGIFLTVACRDKDMGHPDEHDASCAWRQ